METLFVALRVVVALAAVLALLWIVQRKVTRGGAKKGAIAGRFGAPKRAIQVLGTHRLSPKASIAVVEVEGARLVLGVTEHGISVLEPTPTPAATPIALTIAHPEAIATPLSGPTQAAAPAEDPLASAGVGEPAPVDFAAVFREALDEAATEPALATVVEAPAAPESADAGTPDAPRPRRRRMSIPALGEQLVPHLTRTLAAGIGIRVPAEASPASPPLAPTRPASSRSALAAFLENTAPEIGETERRTATRDYSNATPLAASLPVLQRAS